MTRAPILFLHPSRSMIAAQGLYYILTGLWPVVSMQSFELVTGPKTDDWLVQTVGLLLAVIGMTLLARARPAADTCLLGRRHCARDRRHRRVRRPHRPSAANLPRRCGHRARVSRRNGLGIFREPARGRMIATPHGVFDD
jgi:hypothetical protein